jgi:UDP-glucose 4-epimerase
VFHTAAKARVQPSIENPIEFNNVNVGGTLNMLKCCVNYGVSRFIYSSSSSVYGNVEQLPTPEEHKLNPMSPYALQKLIGEQYCKLYSELHGLETVCLRYFNVYGDGMSLEGAYKLVIPIFTDQMLRGVPMTIRGNGEQRRDFTYVDDVVNANIKCMEHSSKLNGDVFNIGNGDNRSVNQIATMMGGSRMHVEPVIEPKETLADNTKAKKVLGWKTTMKIEDWIETYKEKMGI